MMAHAGSIAFKTFPMSISWWEMSPSATHLFDANAVQQTES